MKSEEPVEAKQDSVLMQLLYQVFYRWLLVKGARIQFFLGGCLLISQVVLIVIDSGSRLFHIESPFAGGANEAVELQMGLLAAFMLGNTWFLGGHVRIELLRDKLGRRYQALLDVFSEICGLLYCAAVAWGVWGVASDNLTMGARTDALQIPVAPFQFIFTVALIHFSLILLASAIKNTYHIFKPSRP